MSQVGSHPNVKLLTYSQVEEVSGYVGNFKVKVRKKARYVREDKCTGCGECSTACPVEVAAEFDLGLGKRKAAYRPFPQAVPGAYTIDKRGMPPCRFACPAGVNAMGYVALIAQGKFKEALEVVRRTMPFAGVCGRVCTHPCEVQCERGTVDEPVSIRALKRFIADYELKAGRPKASPLPRTKEEKVAIIGSGPAGLACANDLLREGYPVTVFEAAPKAGGLLRYAIPDYRLPKDALDSEISYLQELGVDIRTNTPVKDLRAMFEQGYGAVFLGTGAPRSQRMGIPGEDTPGVLHALDFLRRVSSGEKVVLGNRVAVIGGGNAAIDAARVALRQGAKDVTIVYRRTRAEMPAEASESEEAENEGVKIAYLAAPVRVRAQGGKLASIECIRMKLESPDASGRGRPVPVEGSEFPMEVDNVIIAVGQAVEREGLPKELNYTSWGTLQVDPVTLETNIDGVFAGGDVVSGPAGVIEAVAAGKEAAISIDRYLRGLNPKEGRPQTRPRVEKVNKEGVEPGKRPAMPTIEVKARSRNFKEVELGLDEKAARAEAQRCLSCSVCCECLECLKKCEAGAIDHEMQDEVLELEAGNIIVATGYQPFDPTPLQQYGYGRLPNVLTALELERLVSPAGPTSGEVLLKDGRHPNEVAIIHCVGSRDTNYHEYCSRVCCMYSMKLGHLVREHVPGARVYEFYIDMRSFGKGFEEFYNKMLQEGTVFIRGRPGEVTEVAETPEEKGKLVVVSEDTLLGVTRRIPVDMVVLSTALEPQADAEEVARLFSISHSPDGFFMEKHPKLDPVATMTDGVFVVGCCQGPKDIPDTVAQASAAAARVLATIAMGQVQLEAIAAVIDEAQCSGCKTCIGLCPYKAISFDEEKKVSRVNEALCKGCGTCVAACPSAAINQRHFTTEQVMAEIEGVLV